MPFMIIKSRWLFLIHQTGFTGINSVDVVAGVNSAQLS